MNKSGDVQQFPSKPGQLKVAQTSVSCENHSWPPHVGSKTYVPKGVFAFYFSKRGGLGVCCVNTFYFLFVQDFIFCKWQYRWSVSLLPSRVYEVAKAATLWLFSHGVGGGTVTWRQGRQYLQYSICRICQGLCTCDVNWTITVISCGLFCRTNRVQCIPWRVFIVFRDIQVVFCEQL